jgi:hypothetical protein
MFINRNTPKRNDSVRRKVDIIRKVYVLNITRQRPHRYQSIIFTVSINTSVYQSVAVQVHSYKA